MLFIVPGWLGYQITKTIYLSDVDFLTLPSCQGASSTFPLGGTPIPPVSFYNTYSLPFPWGACLPLIQHPFFFLFVRPPTSRFCFRCFLSRLLDAGDRACIRPTYSSVPCAPVPYPVAVCFSSYYLSPFASLLPLDIFSPSLRHPDVNHWHPTDPMCLPLGTAASIELYSRSLVLFPQVPFA